MQSIWRCLIVDDERHARLYLRRLLAPFEEQIEVIGEAVDGLEALEKIQKLSPDVVFLDINMPKLDAFQVLEKLNGQLPHIIFTTGYDKYALKAFEVNSIDYLLKPIDPEKFARAINKLKARSKRGGDLKSLVREAVLEMEKAKTKRIQVKDGVTISAINLSEVCFFQGEDDVTGVITSDKRYSTDISLCDLEKKLPETEFVRVHRSTIINMAFAGIMKKCPCGKMKLMMKQPPNTELIISRKYAKTVKERFQFL